jgi:hypothetical protein
VIECWVRTVHFLGSPIVLRKRYSTSNPCGVLGLPFPWLSIMQSVVLDFSRTDVTSAKTHSHHGVCRSKSPHSKVRGISKRDRAWDRDREGQPDSSKLSTVPIIVPPIPRSAEL